VSGVYREITRGVRSLIFNGAILHCRKLLSRKLNTTNLSQFMNADKIFL
jgi:hypothetical protein